MKKKQKRIYIYGKNVVREALMHAPRAVREVYLSPQLNDEKLRSLIAKLKIRTERMDPRKVSSQVEGRPMHQGIIAQISPQGLITPFEEFIGSFEARGSEVLVYLDGVQDPHNAGAIIRSAAAFGASAVLIPEKGASPVTQGVINASAGAIFSIPLVSVRNPQQALSELRQKKVTIYGMAGEGAINIHDEKFEGASLLVMGNEAEGVSPATRALCHKMLRIPIAPHVESLNVASAAAAALFAWSGRHPSVFK